MQSTLAVAIGHKNPGADNMKLKSELQSVIDLIASADSPVGMDAVYVHALILDKLERIEHRLAALEGQSDNRTD
jgi:hypothetical protein